MNIFEGHPGAIFAWFFDTDQSSDHRVNVLFMVYGRGKGASNLSKSCLKEQLNFNEVLGPEIMFIFFDPLTKVTDLASDGDFARAHLHSAETHYLFSGFGEARAVPSAMIEIGREHFRSERPIDYYNEQLAAAAANAHQRAIPFFQQAFNLEPTQSYVLWAHRTLRTISVCRMDDNAAMRSEDLIALFRAIRPTARHSMGPSDLDIIDGLVNGAIQHAAFRSAGRKTWDAIRRLIGAT